MAHRISDTDFFKRTADEAVSLKREDTAPDNNISELMREKTLKKAAEKGRPEEKVPVKAKPLKIAKAVETVLTDSKKTLEAAGFQSMAAELEKLRRCADRERFTIAVVGEFSRGKSTFINKLLGRDFLPEGDLPTTAVMTRIRHHEQEVILAFDKNNRKVLERPLSQESWEGLVAQNFGGEDFQGNVLVGINSEWLRDWNVELIDTPGAGDLSETRAKVVGDALLGCDGAVIAVSATAALSLSEKLFIEERLITRKLPFLLVIITKLDLIGAGERSQVVRYIENRLKSWGMDIPIYIPYSLELGEDSYKEITGMDKVIDEISGWIFCGEREKLAETWILGKASDIMKNAASALTERLLLSEERDEEKRKELVSKKKEQLTKAKLVWGDLRLQMQRRCTECYKMLLEKIDDCAASITERLQYEVSHAGDLQKWWNEDFPYRIKVELTNMSVSVDSAASRRIEEDARWYCGAIEKTFQSHVLYQREKIADKQLFGEFEVGGEVEFEDLGRQRIAIKIGAAVLSISGFALLSSLGFMPIVATMGIGTGATIFSEQFFKKKIEAQRNALKDEIARCVPEFIEQSMEDSERRLEAVYQNMIDEADRSEQAWMDAQQTAMESIRTSEGGRLIPEEGVLLERIKEQNARIDALL